MMAVPIDNGFGQLIAIIGSAMSTTAFLSWFFWRQLAANRKIFYRVISRHNKEDDDNFAILQESITQIHLRNAVRDGTDPPPMRKIPRRRYLIDDGEETGEEAA